MTDCIVTYRALAGLDRHALEERWLGVLPEARRQSLARAADEAAIATLAGIGLLAAGLELLGAAPLSQQGLKFPRQGKPLLVAGPDFNISHAGQLAVCAVIRRGRVGVDIEPFERVRAESLRRVASADELAHVAQGGGAAVLWTRKEAVLKAAGATVFDAAGVRIDATSADFRGERWYFFGPGRLEDCALALAAERAEVSCDLRPVADLA